MMKMVDLRVVLAWFLLLAVLCELGGSQGSIKTRQEGDHQRSVMHSSNGRRAHVQLRHVPVDPDEINRQRLHSTHNKGLKKTSVHAEDLRRQRAHRRRQPPSVVAKNRHDKPPKQLPVMDKYRQVPVMDKYRQVPVMDKSQARLHVPSEAIARRSDQRSAALKQRITPSSHSVPHAAAVAGFSNSRGIPLSYPLHRRNNQFRNGRLKYYGRKYILVLSLK